MLSTGAIGFQNALRMLKIHGEELDIDCIAFVVQMLICPDESHLLMCILSTCGLERKQLFS